MNIEQKMTSKEIADVTGKRHDHVMRDIRNMLEELNLEMPPFMGTSKDSMNRDQEIFNLPKREVELLIMGYSIKLRAKVLDRLREVEAQLANPVKTIPATYAQALLEAGKLALEVEQQQLLIESQKPAVDFCNRISASSDSMKIGEFAKVISKDGDVIGQNKLFKYLRENKILMANNMPYQTYVDRGFFEVVQGVVSNSTTGRIWTTTKITGKGQLALAKKLKQDA